MHNTGNMVLECTIWLKNSVMHTQEEGLGFYKSSHSIRFNMHRPLVNGYCTQTGVTKQSDTYWKTTITDQYFGTLDLAMQMRKNTVRFLVNWVQLTKHLPIRNSSGAALQLSSDPTQSHSSLTSLKSPKRPTRESFVERIIYYPFLILLWHSVRGNSIKMWFFE